MTAKRGMLAQIFLGERAGSLERFELAREAGAINRFETDFDIHDLTPFVDAHNVTFPDSGVNDSRRRRLTRG
jgi:hypothetical protein